MEEKKLVDGEVSSYVVPISVLTAFIVNTNDPESLNNSIIALLDKTGQNDVIKNIFAETSRKLSEAVAEIDPSVTVLLVPNAFIPVKEKQDSDIVVDFVEKFNTAIMERMQNESKE